MNITEAQKTAVVVRFLLPFLDPHADPVDAEEAGEAVAWLAGRATQALGAGPSSEAVAEEWVRQLADVSYLYDNVRPIETATVAPGYL